jgi:hypothetical protein
MSDFKPNNPQTNLSVLKFYQELGYKYKHWLPEFNKYSIVIPTELDKDSNEVPYGMLPNTSIRFTQHPTYPLLTFCPLYYAEGLLARQVIETIPYHFVTTYYDYMYIDTPEYKERHTGWFTEFHWNLNAYNTWRNRYVFDEYPNILFFNTRSDVSRSRKVYKPSGWIEDKSYPLEPYDELRRNSPTTAARYLGNFHVSHNLTKIWGIGGATQTITSDSWRYRWIMANFSTGMSASYTGGDYKSKESINDKRINVLKDVEEVASP